MIWEEQSTRIRNETQNFKSNIMTKMTLESLQNIVNYNFPKNNFKVVAITEKIPKKKKRYYAHLKCPHGEILTQLIDSTKKGHVPRRCSQCKLDAKFLKLKSYYDKERNKSKCGKYSGWTEIIKIDSKWINFNCTMHDKPNQTHKQLKRNFKLGELPRTCTGCLAESYKTESKSLDSYNDQLRSSNLIRVRESYIVDEHRFNHRNDLNRIPVICTWHNNYQFTVHKTNLGRYLSCPQCKKEEKSRLSKKTDILETVNTRLATIKEEYDLRYEYVRFKRKPGKDIKVYLNCKNIRGKHHPFLRNIYHLSPHMCPHCYSNEYKGELAVEAFLIKNGFAYEKQISFEDCKFKNQLKFDFQVTLNSGEILIIEFDGEQHFKMPKRWGGKKKWLICNTRDKVKNNYVFEKSINFVRIPYTEFKSIAEILEREINLITNGFCVFISSNDIIKDLYDKLFRKTYLKL